MAVRCLNKIMLIGNLTRDPELRYAPSGTPVSTFGLATNRQWVTEAGERREEAEFHRIVAWNKLAELCAQLLTKGRKVYVEGRIQTRSWTGSDGQQRTTTEIVIDDMIILDSKRSQIATGEEKIVEKKAVEKEVKDLTGEKDVIQVKNAQIKEEKEETKGKGKKTDEKESKKVEKKKVNKDDVSSEEELESGKDKGGEVVNPDEIPF